MLTLDAHGAWRSLVARVLWEHEVASSSLAAPIAFSIAMVGKPCRAMAAGNRASCRNRQRRREPFSSAPLRAAAARSCARPSRRRGSPPSPRPKSTRGTACAAGRSRRDSQMTSRIRNCIDVEERQVVVERRRQPDPGGLRGRPEVPRPRRPSRIERSVGLPMERQAAGLGQRDGPEIVDEPSQDLRLVEDRGEVLLVGRVDSVEDRLDVALNDRQRRPQLVAGRRRATFAAAPRWLRAAWPWS